MSANSIQFLGCGPSAGVPIVGNPAGPYWGVCDPNESKNRRLRSSAYVVYQGIHFLIDASPDLRQQMLNCNISKIDCVLITHIHADHTHGIDDLRPVVFGRNRNPLPLITDAQTMTSLRRNFDYIFAPPTHAHYFPIFQPMVIDQHLDVMGVGIQAFEQEHGVMTSLGFRFGNMAYSTDFMNLDDSALAHLKDLDLWILDCLGTRPKPTHNHLTRALNWIEKVNPKRAILTHMGHELDYQSLIDTLPPHIYPAYDGLRIAF